MFQSKPELRSEESQREQPEDSLKPLYARTLLTSLGSGFIDPFVSIYAVQMGAKPTDMGWYRSVPQLSGAVSQVPFGALVDRVGRRVPFIFLGGILSTILWPLLLYAETPLHIVAIVAGQALIGSVVAPAWTALMGDLIPPRRRGEVTASINIGASVGAALATLASGYVMAAIGGSPRQMYSQRCRWSTPWRQASTISTS